MEVCSHYPAALTAGMTHYIRLVEPQGRSRLVRKFSHTSVFDPRTFQTVAIRSSVACIKLILKCILLVYIILGDKLVFGKYNFLHGNLF